MRLALNKFVSSLGLASAMLILAGSASAEVTVSWTAPSESGTYIAGQLISLTGNANSNGLIGGTGLDLALVLDSSGSMTTVSGGKSRSTWLKEASVALVDALPGISTSVTVVDFDSDALLVRSLTALSADKASVVSGIQKIDAAGGTNIGAGIDLAAKELTGANHAAGRSQMMVVVSDGSSSGNPPSNAAAALAAGVDAIHAVGIPGHSVNTMQGIATAGNGIYTNASDLSALINLFNGTAGNLVGVERVDLTLNDGSFIAGVAMDGLGNFSVPDVVLQAGENIFTAVAFDALGNSATRQLVLSAAPVPEPEAYAMFGMGLLLLAAVRRRRV